MKFALLALFFASATSFAQDRTLPAGYPYDSGIASTGVCGATFNTVAQARIYCKAYGLAVYSYGSVIGCDCAYLPGGNGGKFPGFPGQHR